MTAGLTSISTEMDGKRLDLLREVIPAVSHVAVLWNAAGPLQVLAEQQTQAAARVLRIEVLSLGVRNEDDIAPADHPAAGAPARDRADRVRR